MNPRGFAGRRHKAAWLAAGGLGALAAGLAVSALFAQTGGVYDLSWGSVHGGGGVSGSGGLSLAGAIGQADAHSSVGGPYQVRGGVLAADYGPPGPAIAQKDYVPNAAKDAP